MKLFENSPINKTQIIWILIAYIICEQVENIILKISFYLVILIILKIIFMDNINFNSISC